MTMKTRKCYSIICNPRPNLSPFRRDSFRAIYNILFFPLYMRVFLRSYHAPLIVSQCCLLRTEKIPFCIITKTFIHYLFLFMSNLEQYCIARISKLTTLLIKTTH